MTTDPQDRNYKPLVTVGEHSETDLATGRTERRRFVKMYFEARDSGLLADMPDEIWKTLCCLATYVDENGFCYPSQERLARDLGVGRQAANRRVQRLKEYRFNGRSVMSLEKTRVRSAKGPTRWGNNVYRLLPIAGFEYGKAEAPKESGDFSVSRQRDIERSVSLSVQPLADTARRDTNKIQVQTRKHTPGVIDPSRGEDSRRAEELVRYFHEQAGHSKARQPTARELEQARTLLAEHGVEACRYAVKFALQIAEETGFRVQHLGGIQGQLSDGFERFQTQQENERRRATEVERQREEDRALEDERRAWQKLTPEERIEKRVQTSLITFSIVNRREPTEDDIEQLRRKYALQEYGGQETASGEAANG